MISFDGKPYIGDERYRKFPNKVELDRLRVQSYEQVEPKDLQITFCNKDKEAFSNDFHLIVNSFLVRGNNPYRIMFEHDLDYSTPNPTGSIVVRTTVDTVFNHGSDKQFAMLREYIERITGCKVNLIFTDIGLNEVFFARIGDGAFNQHASYNQPGFNSFFYNLVDSDTGINPHNIVYIGPDMISNTPYGEVIRTNDEIIIPYKEETADENRIRVAELDSFNSEITQRILKL